MNPAQQSTPSEPSSPIEAPDEYDGVVSDRLDAATVRRLSQVSSPTAIAHICMEWLLILSTALMVWKHWSPLLYLGSVAFIGARQHALIVLAHDAAHYRLVRNRSVNDWMGEIFLAWPFVLFTMQAYRRNHFPHHRYLNTARDPDWVRKRTPEWEFPKSRLAMASMLVSYALGIGFLKFFFVAARLPTAPSKEPNQRAFSIARGCFLVSTAIALTALHLWIPYLLFWVVPHITWMQMCFHVRSIAEHFAIRGSSGIYAQTRTVIPTWFDRVFVLPKNANYHLEHHLYPSVPFYRLPELHRILMLRPEYRQSAHITRGYLGVLRECVANG